MLAINSATMQDATDDDIIIASSPSSLTNDVIVKVPYSVSNIFIALYNLKAKVSKLTGCELEYRLNSSKKYCLANIDSNFQPICIWKFKKNYVWHLGVTKKALTSLIPPGPACFRLHCRNENNHSASHGFRAFHNSKINPILLDSPQCLTYKAFTKDEATGFLWEHVIPVISKCLEEQKKNFRGLDVDSKIIRLGWMIKDRAGDELMATNSVSGVKTDITLAKGLFFKISDDGIR